jgi:hypothetical protein
VHPPASLPALPLTHGPPFLVKELLAMVPQPVAAVLLLFPITKETDAAAREGVARLDTPPVHGLLR